MAFGPGCLPYGLFAVARWDLRRIAGGFTPHGLRQCRLPCIGREMTPLPPRTIFLGWFCYTHSGGGFAIAGSDAAMERDISNDIIIFPNKSCHLPALVWKTKLARKFIPGGILRVAYQSGRKCKDRVFFILVYKRSLCFRLVWYTRVRALGRCRQFRALASTAAVLCFCEPVR